jgi:hypothetical protein
MISKAHHLELPENRKSIPPRTNKAGTPMATNLKITSLICGSLSRYANVVYKMLSGYLGLKKAIF